MKINQNVTMKIYIYLQHLINVKVFELPKNVNSFRKYAFKGIQHISGTIYGVDIYECMKHVFGIYRKLF